ncbi:hypothetical protein HMPREF3203_00752 [Proteus mirabilis]|nr:hypothetical protein HMPREF3203_00752 [Proteus mirabilis]
MFCLVDKTEFKSVFTKQKPGAFFKWQLLISWCANLVARKLLKATFQLWKLARKNVAYVLVYILPLLKNQTQHCVKYAVFV